MNAIGPVNARRLTPIRDKRRPGLGAARPGNRLREICAKGHRDGSAPERHTGSSDLQVQCGSADGLPRGLLNLSFWFGAVPRRFFISGCGPSCEPGCAQGKQDRRDQPLEVDGCGGEEGLDSHVYEGAPCGSGRCVECFGRPAGTLETPAVAGMEAGFGLTPGPVDCVGRAARQPNTSTWFSVPWTRRVSPPFAMHCARKGQIRQAS